MAYTDTATLASGTFVLNDGTRYIAHRVYESVGIAHSIVPVGASMDLIHKGNVLRSKSSFMDILLGRDISRREYIKVRLWFRR